MRHGSGPLNTVSTGGGALVVVVVAVVVVAGVVVAGVVVEADVTSVVPGVDAGGADSSGAANVVCGGMDTGGGNVGLGTTSTAVVDGVVVPVGTSPVDSTAVVASGSEIVISGALVSGTVCAAAGSMKTTASNAEAVEATVARHASRRKPCLCCRLTGAVRSGCSARQSTTTESNETATQNGDTRSRIRSRRFDRSGEEIALDLYVVLDHHRDQLLETNLR